MEEWQVCREPCMKVYEGKAWALLLTLQFVQAIKVENRQVKKLRKDAYRNRRKSVLDDDQKKWFFTRQAYDYTCGHGFAIGNGLTNPEIQYQAYTD
ncbi:hypothetical protein JHK87_001814 [Glycine soja]|nr:hypothetical protein JHK87_001814 [Glycine soja]